LLFLLGIVLAVVVVGTIVLIGDRETAPSQLDAVSGEGTDALTRDEPAIPAVPTPSGPVDTLAYSIQVAAWASLDDAFEHYGELVDAGVSATISAVARDSTSVWYRVFAGAVPDRPAADELRGRLRSQGIIGAVRGVLAITPHAFLLSTHPDAASGRREVEGLRESGIPAYIVSMPDESVQVLFGAFESPEQAELADSVLAGAGRSLSRVLVTRVGIAR
jgi:cell division septation protein DedD